LSSEPDNALPRARPAAVTYGPGCHTQALALQQLLVLYCWCCVHAPWSNHCHASHVQAFTAQFSSVLHLAAVVLQDLLRSNVL
jgi:hypothetical protein